MFKFLKPKRKMIKLDGTWKLDDPNRYFLKDKRPIIGWINNIKRRWF